MTRPHGWAVATIWLGVAVGLLGGCGSVPPVHHYLLAVPQAAESNSSAATVGEGPVLRLAILDAASPYDQDRLVYRVGATTAEVGFYEQHRWAGPPASLVTEALFEGLRTTAGVSLVEPGEWEPGTLALSGRLLWLEELDLDDGIHARVGLDLVLRNTEGEPQWQRRFTASHQGSTTDVAGVIELLRQALGDVVAEVEDAVTSSIETGSIESDSNP